MDVGLFAKLTMCVVSEAPRQCLTVIVALGVTTVAATTMITCISVPTAVLCAGW